MNASTLFKYYHHTQCTKILQISTISNVQMRLTSYRPIHIMKLYILREHKNRDINAPYLQYLYMIHKISRSCKYQNTKLRYRLL